jgi:hypothetical protein
MGRKNIHLASAFALARVTSGRMRRGMYAALSMRSDGGYLGRLICRGRAVSGHVQGGS